MSDILVDPKLIATFCSSRGGVAFSIPLLPTKTNLLSDCCTVYKEGDQEFARFHSCDQHSVIVVWLDEDFEEIGALSSDG